MEAVFRRISAIGQITAFHLMQFGLRWAGPFMSSPILLEDWRWRCRRKLQLQSGTHCHTTVDLPIISALLDDLFCTWTSWTACLYISHTARRLWFFSNFCEWKEMCHLSRKRCCSRTIRLKVSICLTVVGSQSDFFLHQCLLRLFLVYNHHSLKPASSHHHQQTLSD